MSRENRRVAVVEEEGEIKAINHARACEVLTVWAASPTNTTGAYWPLE